MKNAMNMKDMKSGNQVTSFWTAWPCGVGRSLRLSYKPCQGTRSSGSRGGWSHQDPAMGQCRWEPGAERAALSSPSAWWSGWDLAQAALDRLMLHLGVVSPCLPLSSPLISLCLQQRGEDPQAKTPTGLGGGPQKASAQVSGSSAWSVLGGQEGTAGRRPQRVWGDPGHFSSSAQPRAVWRGQEILSVRSCSSEQRGHHGHAGRAGAVGAERRCSVLPACLHAPVVVGDVGWDSLWRARAAIPWGSTGPYKPRFPTSPWVLVSALCNVTLFPPAAPAIFSPCCLVCVFPPRPGTPSTVGATMNLLLH